MVGRQTRQLAERPQARVQGGEQKISEPLLSRLVQRLLVLLRERVQPRLGRGLLQSLERIGDAEHLFGPVKGRQDDCQYATAGSRQAPAGMTFQPLLNVRFFQFGDRQSTAVLAEIIEIADGAVAVAGAQRFRGDAPLAVLDVFRADAGHQPSSIVRRLAVGVAQLDASQRPLGGSLVLLASDPLAVFVQQRHAPFRPGRRVVPAIGLLPEPSGTVPSAALFATSSHATGNPAGELTEAC